MLWRRGDPDGTAGGSANLLRASDQRYGDWHVVRDRCLGGAETARTDRPRLLGRYVVVRKCRGLGAGAAEQLQCHQGAAEAAWRGECDPVAVSDFRNGGSAAVYCS